MPYITVEIWDATGSKKDKAEVPNDIPVNRIIVRLVERLAYPQKDPTGNQLLSYKLHHQRSRRQLGDSQTLAEANVVEGDVLRMTPEITAGRA